jgi:hypothetical protein
MPFGSRVMNVEWRFSRCSTFRVPDLHEQIRKTAEKLLADEVGESLLYNSSVRLHE